jgi:hypothetical protein
VNPLDLLTVTADFKLEPILADTLISSIVLPLDEDKDNTLYTFTFKDNTVVTLTVAYTRTNSPYHVSICGQQTIFSGINILASGFESTEPIKILNASAKFPVVNNIEILQ